MNTLAEVFPHAILVDRLGEDAIEDEEFPTLGDIDREAGGSRDVDHGPLEALGDQLIPGVFGFEGGTNANGWNRMSTARREDQQERERRERYSPTLTAVLLSSSEARLPCLLLILRRLVLLGVRIKALKGRGDAPVGEPGGEGVMALYGTGDGIGGETIRGRMGVGG